MILFLIIRAGVLCAYAANQNLSSQLKSMRRLVKSNLKDLHTFANQTPAVSNTSSTVTLGWTDGRTDRQTEMIDGRMVVGWTDREIDGWMNRQTEKMDGWMEG